MFRVLTLLSFVLIIFSSCEKKGCTNPNADNYDPDATEDDGKCRFSGCIDPSADNFDNQANVDDGSCIYGGCTDPTAANYDPDANQDNGSCQFLGCTNPDAENYDPDANTDDGSCILKGCTNPDSDNYNPEATEDDGSCFREGCMEPGASNYDSLATVAGACSYDRFYEIYELADPIVNDTTRLITWAFQVYNSGAFGVEACSSPFAEGECLIDSIQSKGGDFIVSENGSPISTEAKATFRPDDIPSSFKSLLLIDISSSVEGLVPQIKDAAKAFVDSKTTEQEIAIYTFDADTSLIAPFTADASALKVAIDSIPETGLGGTTNIWGSVNNVYDILPNSSYTADSIFSASLVIFTDGLHTAGNKSSLLSQARSGLDDRAAFVVGLRTDDFNNGGEADAQTFLGGFFSSSRILDANDINELSQEFQNAQAQIISLTTSIYYLQYTTPIIFQSSNVPIKVEIVGNGNSGSSGSINSTFSINPQ